LFWCFFFGLNLWIDWDSGQCQIRLVCHERRIALQSAAHPRGVGHSGIAVANSVAALTLYILPVGRRPCARDVPNVYCPVPPSLFTECAKRKELDSAMDGPVCATIVLAIGVPRQATHLANVHIQNEEFFSMTKNTLPKSVTDGVEGPSWVDTMLASRIANVKRGGRWKSSS
jgi:hypothetical protein